MIEAWRIDRAIYRATAFTGEGARLYGGRWNSQGISVVYAAENRSLAMLEILVHMRKPKGYELYSLKFDESLVQELAIKTFLGTGTWSLPWPIPRKLETTG